MNKLKPKLFSKTVILCLGLCSYYTSLFILRNWQMSSIFICSIVCISLWISPSWTGSVLCQSFSDSVLLVKRQFGLPFVTTSASTNRALHAVTFPALFSSIARSSVSRSPAKWPAERSCFVVCASAVFRPGTVALANGADRSSRPQSDGTFSPDSASLFAFPWCDKT